MLMTRRTAIDTLKMRALRGVSIIVRISMPKADQTLSEITAISVKTPAIQATVAPAEVGAANAAVAESAIAQAFGLTH